MAAQVIRGLDRRWREPTYQAYQLLHLAFSAILFIAGFDKFFDLLANWDSYLAPVVPPLMDVSPHAFMQTVGGIEMIIGIGVALLPEIFGYAACVWFAGITINLLAAGHHEGLALGDFGLCVSAAALGRLRWKLLRDASTRKNRPPRQARIEFSHIKVLPVRLIDRNANASIGEVRIESWSESSRTVRALKLLLACWAAAAVSVFIPLAHFVLVPSLLVAGVIGGLKRYSQKEIVLGGRGPCPHCGKPFKIARGPNDWPLSDLCEDCQAFVSIEKAA